MYTFMLLKQAYTHETWITQASYIAAFVQQKSSATQKQFTSYGGSNIKQLVHKITRLSCQGNCMKHSVASRD